MHAILAVWGSRTQVPALRTDTHGITGQWRWDTHDCIVVLHLHDDTAAWVLGACSDVDRAPAVIPLLLNGAASLKSAQDIQCIICSIVTWRCTSSVLQSALPTDLAPMHLSHDT